MAATGQQEPASERVRVRRLPARGRYDRDTVAAILDEALICHVGIVEDGQPYVIPTIHSRIGDRLVLHGSTGSRTLRGLMEGGPVCVTATVLDGLVMARSGFHHSMNYRSVMVLGTARPVTDEDRRMEALRAVVEHVVPGRWDEIRPPSAKELSATLLVEVDLDEASAKVRTGPPIDGEEDMDLKVWAGVLPLRMMPLEPVPDPALRVSVDVPPSVARWTRGGQPR
jgi:hypothetical protein